MDLDPVLLSRLQFALTIGFLFEGTRSDPLFWIFFLLFLISVILIPISLKGVRYGRAFLYSSVAIASIIGVSAVSLFPRLVPSLTDLAYSLTAYNASSTPRTLTVMLIMALIGMPLVIGYTIYIYRVFRGKAVITDESY